MDGCQAEFRLGEESLYEKNAGYMVEKTDGAELPTPEGRLLRAWRKHRNKLSQDALGAAVKKGGDKAMDGALVGHYERGTHRPSIDQLLDIILALGVPGKSEEERLARFFAGPEATLISAADVERDLADLARLRSLERQLGELLGAGRGGR